MSEEKAIQERPVFEKCALAAKGMFLQVAGGEETLWLKEIGFALQMLRNSDRLQDVAKTRDGAQSITNAVTNIALIGITLNPAMALAYLVPRDGKCCLDVSYRGLIKIATDSGSVKHLAAHLVYKGDDFSWEEIDGEVHVTRRPNLNPTEDLLDPRKFWDNVVCGYTVAILHDGTKIISSPFPIWKLKKARDTSKAKNGPWATHPDEMCLKTMIKHTYKTLPCTDRMAEAVAILNEQEGLDREAGKKDRKRDILSRFENECSDAEFSEIGDGPQLCGQCGKLLVEGKCHNPACPEAEPPEA